MKLITEKQYKTLFQALEGQILELPEWKPLHVTVLKDGRVILTDPRPGVDDWYQMWPSLEAARKHWFEADEHGEGPQRPTYPTQEALLQAVQTGIRELQQACPKLDLTGIDLQPATQYLRRKQYDEAMQWMPASPLFDSIALYFGEVVRQKLNGAWCLGSHGEANLKFPGGGTLDPHMMLVRHLEQDSPPNLTELLRAATAVHG